MTLRSRTISLLVSLAVIFGVLCVSLSNRAYAGPTGPSVNTCSEKAVTCMAADDWLARAVILNPKYKPKILTPDELVLFTVNHNNLEPKTTQNLTAVVALLNPDTGEVVFAIEVDGCIRYAASLLYADFFSLMQHDRET